MRESWKLALIGGEVTLLAAFTGVGIHLAIRPHRTAFQPPPLVLPTSAPAAIPRVSTPLVPVRPPSASPPEPSVGPELFRKLGEQDHKLLLEQWDVVQRLSRAIERYVEDRLLQQTQKR